MTEAEINKAVRWRYRICHYLFRLGAIWIITGAVVGLFRYPLLVVGLVERHSGRPGCTGRILPSWL